MLSGKGMWLWEIDRTEAHPARMVELARAADIEHILVKLSDGEYSYPIPATDPDGRKERLTHDVIVAFRKAGITVWGWGFVYGSEVDQEAQAHRLAARVRQYELPGVAVNAEDYGRYRWSVPGGVDRARRFMETLRNDLAGVSGSVLIAFSSYRYPSWHPDFPFAAFMAACDIAMPQVYWPSQDGGDPVRTLEDSYQEYRAAFPGKPFIPTGSAYGEYYGSGAGRFFWSARPDQIALFLHRARTLGCPAVNLWSWQHARNDSANHDYPGTQLWDAAAAYDYTATPVDPIPTPQAGPESVIITVGGAGYHDGVYDRASGGFREFIRGGERLKSAPTSSARSSLWAAWVPESLAPGIYEIAAWVPGVNADTRRARYAIHGVAGCAAPLRVEINQGQFYDAWASLGVFALDEAHSRRGMVNLTNLTGEEGRRIAFGALRWRLVDPASDEGSDEPADTPAGLADGFDPPVGTLAERRGDTVWPGEWVDSTGFGTRYTDSGGNAAYHTGADLNLNRPSWNRDAGMPVYAVASGVVVYVGSPGLWGNIVIIRHDPLTPGGPAVYSRSAHLAAVNVRIGQRVRRGEPLGTIGRPRGGTEHLHFDISLTEALAIKPNDWPGLDRARLLRDYVDPRAFIRRNRPR